MNKKNLSTSLTIISVLLAIGAIFTFFAPAVSVGFAWDRAIYNDMWAWGTLGSFFTLAFGLDSIFVCKSTNFTSLYDPYQTHYLSFGPNAGLIAIFITEVLLIVVGVITIVLIARKKYKGKIKLILPFFISCLLIVAIVLSFSSTLFFDKLSLYSKMLEIPDFLSSDYNFSALYIASGPIAYIIVCSFALYTSVANIVINYKENFAKQKK